MRKLVETILDVRNKIVAGVFVNEDHVSKGVVLRLLGELDWDVHDPNAVCSEHRIGERRVDYALVREPFGPVVLIEVKRVGKLRAKGEEQLFDYCAKRGVPLAVLTDGKEWRFYFPAGMGNYEQRRFATVHLVDDDATDCALRLLRYLGFGGVRSGESQTNAMRDYRDHSEAIVVREQFPAVLDALVAKADPKFVELFCDEVESRCHIRPGGAAVGDFLRGLSRRRQDGKDLPGPRPEPVLTPSRSDGHHRFVLRGEEFSFESGRALFVGVFRVLAERDPGFLERAALRVGGQVRPYLSRDRQEVMKGRDWSSPPAELPGGWWIRVQFRRSGMERILRRAADAAGLVWGDDLIVE